MLGEVGVDLFCGEGEAVGVRHFGAPRDCQAVPPAVEVALVELEELGAEHKLLPKHLCVAQLHEPVNHPEAVHPEAIGLGVFGDCTLEQLELAPQRRAHGVRGDLDERREDLAAEIPYGIELGVDLEDLFRVSALGFMAWVLGFGV